MKDSEEIIYFVFKPIKNFLTNGSINYRTIINIKNG